jgi:poly(A) polymerase Pap1
MSKINKLSKETAKKTYEGKDFESELRKEFEKETSIERLTGYTKYEKWLESKLRTETKKIELMEDKITNLEEDIGFHKFRRQQTEDKLGKVEKLIPVKEINKLSEHEKILPVRKLFKKYCNKRAKDCKKSCDVCRYLWYENLIIQIISVKA